MMNLTPNPRRVQIMEAFLSLMRQGKRISTIKVQDIATAAGMGKGTLYEYFSSKEEILIHTVHYCVDQELVRLENSVRLDCSFEQAVHRFLEEFLGRTMGILPVIRLIVEQLTEEQRNTMQREPHGLVCRDRLRDIERVWFDRGRQEGLIGASCTDEYCELVFVSALMGLVTYCMSESMQNRDESEQNAARMIFRALKG